MTRHGVLAPRRPSPAPAGLRLWRAWLVWTTAGEIAGFLVPAVVGALTVRYPARASVPALLLAGAAEGALLGATQAHVLCRALPGLPRRRWTAVTSAAAVVAYLIGLLPSLTAGTIGRWPLPVLVALAAAGGAVLLSSIGVAQWTVLRRFVPRAGRWIAITAAAWLVGLAAFMLIASPLWHAGQPPALTVAIGVLGGIAMAATVAAVTGAGLVRLLRAPPARLI
ncbi:MAG TPA: hypothetical protein VFR67_04110 [Pilimelia sp.]|nr:hypothetical protein [Pilimelia sp.]